MWFKFKDTGLINLSRVDEIDTEELKILLYERKSSGRQLIDIIEYNSEEEMMLDYDALQTKLLNYKR